MEMEATLERDGYVLTSLDGLMETVRTNSPRVACDGARDIRGGAALGHPRMWLEIDESRLVECGYCDRRFVLVGGPADNGSTNKG